MRLCGVGLNELNHRLRGLAEGGIRGKAIEAWRLCLCRMRVEKLHLERKLRASDYALNVAGAFEFF